MILVRLSSRYTSTFSPGGAAVRLAAAGALASLLALLLIIPAGAAGASVAGGARLAVQPAAGNTFSVARQAITGTVTTGASDASGAAPNAVDTAQPQSVSTAQAPAIQTGGPAGVAGTDATSAGSTTAGDSGAWIPWLVGAIIVAGLAGLGVFAIRQRSAPAPAQVPATAPPATVASTAPLEILPEAAPAAAVTQIRCPNCDAMNPADRRYCDECGQDLRPATAAATAAPIPEVDEATTPYLETLSRVDEQLEFVLARNVIKIGRALDNDIVIDDQFMGWQTVSPQHARLTRQPEGFVVEDLNSENGTFVNSARTGQNLLEDGMTLAFGKVEFIYRVPHE